MNSRAEEIFLEAIEFDASDRAGYLRTACGDDEGLVDEVLRMLEDAERADAFFGDSQGLTLGAPEISRYQSEQPGDRIGPYVLRERLGEGGFGVVWLAEQTAPIRRLVALKVVKPGLDTVAVLARFEAERQALAMMEHPHITRVFDAGATPTGRPYFAMEAVEGTPITAFCDEWQLEKSQRLLLFRQVCAAIGHAHQKGVIHRDIKPSNVLVSIRDNEAFAKVIDFGVAKAVQGKLTEQTLVTQADQVLGTPVYMSPEQAGLGGGDIDTRSDVYGLGVLLYELLVGCPPFDRAFLLAAGYDEMRRIIREIEPPKPSAKLTTMGAADAARVAQARRLSPAKLKEAVEPDLDWIVMKALEKERDRRYETVEAFDRDIAAFLADQPVEARPPNPGYLFRKFTRRHRGPIQLAALGIFLLIAATAFSVWQAVRATRAEHLASEKLAEAIAAREAQTLALSEKDAALADKDAALSEKDTALADAETVSALMADIFRQPKQNVEGRTVTIADALDSNIETIGQRLAGHPRRQVLFKNAIAQTYEGLGLYGRAVALREEALGAHKELGGGVSEETIALLRDLVETHSLNGDATKAIEVAEELLGAAESVYGISHATTASIQTRLSELRAQASETAAMSNSGGGGRAPQSEQDIDPSSENSVEGRLAKKRQRLKELDDALIELRRKFPPESPEILHALAHMAKEYHRAWYPADGARIQEEVVALHHRRYGSEHIDSLRAELDLAYLNWRCHKWGKASQAWTILIPRLEKVAGLDAPETIECKELLAISYYYSGRFDDSCELYDQVVESRKRTNKTGLPVPPFANEGHMRARAAAGKIADMEGTYLPFAKEAARTRRDDTYQNQVLACLEIWFGQIESYNETRTYMLDYAISKRDAFTSQPHILFRNMQICSLMPYSSSTQQEEVNKTIEIAKRIQSAPGAAPEVSGHLEWRVSIEGIVAFRSGRLAEAVALFQSVVPEPHARFYHSMALAQLGDLESAVAIFHAAVKEMPPMPPDDQPLLRIPMADGKELLSFITYREAKAFFDAAGVRVEEATRMSLPQQPAREVEALE